MGRVNPLPIRSMMERDESVAGYFYRSLVNNYFGSPTPLSCYMTKPLLKNHNNDFTDSEMTTLNKLLVVEGPSIFNNNAKRLKTKFGVDNYLKMVIKNKIKYCPLCIKQKRYHRYAWSINCLHCCVLHQQVLIEACSNCKQSINLWDFTRGICNNCNFLFGSSPMSLTTSILTSGIVLESQRAIYNFCSVDDYLVFGKYTSAHFVTLAFHSFHLLEGARDLTNTSNSSLSIFHKRRDQKRDSYNAALAVANVYWMYLGFPDNFYIVLDYFLERTSKRNRYDKLQRFVRLFEDKAFTDIENAYKDFFVRQVDCGEVRKDFSVFKGDPKLLSKRTRVRREEIRKDIGTSYEKLSQLNNIGEISLDISTKDAKSQYWIDSTMFQSYLEDQKSRISRGEVALMLGVTKTSVQKIINVGLLPMEQKESESYGKVYRQDVLILLGKCRGKEATSIKGCLPLNKALIKYSVNGLSIAHLIEFTIRDMLHPKCLTNAGTLRDNYYREDELLKCLEEIKKEQQQHVGYTQADIIKVFRVGERRLKKILSEHHIDPDFTMIMKDGRKRYYYKVHKIEVIRKSLGSDIKFIDL
ncbi:TniQ protein [Paenibacillus sp. BK033]|uniref:TniQ family protein n=1 Tax=Paenibacillus sp. BK033 TaxID=2512133 RepID=UPI001048DA39|nr:TniQ family protein [Paenibacillus sp. BK033]TCM99447.1 TniQ protein [Paenibacillus sp. BK033]